MAEPQAQWPLFAHHHDKADDDIVIALNPCSENLMSILNRLFMRRHETKEQKIQRLEIEIAQNEKELAVLWEIERDGGYLFGHKNEIINLERKLVRQRKELEFLKLLN